MYKTMNVSNEQRILKACCFLFMMCMGVTAFSEVKPLVDFSSESVSPQIATNGKSDVEFKIVDTDKGKALDVTSMPGKNSYPGVVVTSKDGAWNLAKFGRIEAEVKNLSSKKMTVTVRVDNDGDWRKKPWNSEKGTIEAGKTKILTVTFGYSWGKKAFPLDAAKIKRILIFTGKPKNAKTFRIISLKTAGKPGEKPKVKIAKWKKKVKPVNGVLVDFKTYPLSAINERGTKTLLSKKQAEITFPADLKNKWPGAFFPQPNGYKWNLADYNQVEFTLRNPGREPVKAMCRVDNKGANGKFHCISGGKTIAAGAKEVITLSFIENKVWDGSKHRDKSGTTFDSSKVTGVLVFTKNNGKEQKLVLESVKASAAPAPEMPAWLGKRPPVPGSWTLTFEDNFDGDKLDRTKWVIPDKVKTDDIHPMEVDGAKSWWGRDNCISSKNIFVEDGLMKIKCEKTADLKDADPNIKKYKYVTSLAKTYGKFTQKYGYIESRMKVPDVLGMWPAFWTMPDRGKEAGIWWKRQHTSKGGMEFDIMEFLGRYGPYRYNVAMHWDGYKKDHKSTGTEDIYFHPDKDGFMTTGLLWKPGKASFYVNGRLVGFYESERICSVPVFLMYTMPVGGWGTDGIVDDDKLPAYFEVDYVRVWQNDEWEK